ncbi:hypothetical protein KFE25_011006 [Diacronema lutheri]|uniref:Ubiquitin carboxyl-terminal hydrolase n=1 Tax=Diacronema lutheri TaxID=2081491 RepID=A0A8J5XAT9_DIALT|nr:hypothetical protein KFE25_011006 [Diacronema lutheri]
MARVARLHVALVVGALVACAPAATEARRRARGRAASRLRGGSDAATSFQQQYWIPLESSPEVFNDFARRMGVGAGWAFADVLGLDDELLQMVPQPCIAVVLLFPVSPRLSRSELARARRRSERAVSPRVFFMRQYVGNACGTVAALHALLNNRQHLSLGAGPLRELVATGEGEGESDGEGAQACDDDQAPADAELLGERMSSSTGVMAASESSGQLGGTPAPARGVDADYHYICFVQSAADGCLYELDGTKPSPINHGPVADGLLRDAARAIKRHFVTQMPDGHFNVMALVKDEDGSLAAARD